MSHAQAQAVAAPAASRPPASAADAARPSQAELRAAWLRPEVLFPAGTLSVVTLVHLGPSARGIIGAGFVATLVVLAAIDLSYRLLPNWIVLPAAGLVLVLQLAFYPGQAAEWIAASLGTALFFFVPHLASASGVGMGDVKLGLLLGAMLGKDVIAGLLIGLLTLWPIAIYLFAKHGWSARKQTLPLGPSLAFGAIVALLLGV